jgi:GNAT superfamily N-acetyltransferase
MEEPSMSARYSALERGGLRERIIFTTIKKRSRAARLALPLWLAFRAEIQDNGDENPVAPLPDFRRRVNHQGARPDMHFDLMRAGKKKTPIGFAHYAVDKGTIGGRIDPGGGVFLSYYIAPAYRRQGYGRRMFLHCAETLYRDGAAHLYCCPDPVTGEPFWRAMGFEDSGIFDPDDRLNIFMKKRPDPAGIECRAMRREDLHVHMMDRFEFYREITRQARKSGRVVKLRRPKVELTGADDGADFIKYWFISSVAVQEFYHGSDDTFAAFAGGQVLGFAVLRDRPLGKEKDIAQLLRMFMSLDCRRMGLGKRLFKLCAETARAAGMRRLVVNTDRSVESQAFYRAVGCAPMGKDEALPKEIRAGKRDILMEFTL